jgi:hypothetical protein
LLHGIALPLRFCGLGCSGKALLLLAQDECDSSPAGPLLPTTTAGRPARRRRLFWRLSIVDC